MRATRVPWEASDLERLWDELERLPDAHVTGNPAVVAYVKARLPGERLGLFDEATGTVVLDARLFGGWPGRQALRTWLARAIGESLFRAEDSHGYGDATALGRAYAEAAGGGPAVLLAFVAPREETP
ncbi:MAG: hypothetical protein AMXMBFR64_32470 [Myxococcales bacterium]